MPLIEFSIRLDRIDEALLYQAKDGSFWLSCVCSFDKDAKGRMVVAQSITKERYAAGERGPALGVWREIGQAKPSDAVRKNFDLIKYKAVAQPKPPIDDKRLLSEESLFPSPDAAYNAVNSRQQEPKPTEPNGFKELGL